VRVLDQENNMGRNMGRNMARNHLTRLTCAVALALPLALSTAQAQDRFKVAIGQINNWENQAPTLGDQFFKKNNLALETFGTAGAGETMQPVIAASADFGAGVGVAGVMRAFERGAPVRILLPMFTGTSDIYWYVRADSPIKSLKDATDRQTIAYSTNGSTSHNIVLAFVSDLGVKAKPTATGGPPATLTAVMSGQIDVGWAAPPFGLQEEKDGKIRIIGRGSDATSLHGQTIRVMIVNADTLKNRKDAVLRYARAYREAVDWMYTSAEVPRLYARGDADRRGQGHRRHHARCGEAQVPRQAADGGAADGADPDPAAELRCWSQLVGPRISLRSIRATADRPQNKSPGTGRGIWACPLGLSQSWP
jgi:NitT/TauT family transport system substrate-binding protein